MFVNDEAALYYMCSLREQLCTAGKSDFQKRYQNMSTPGWKGNLCPSTDEMFETPLVRL